MLNGVAVGCFLLSGVVLAQALAPQNKEPARPPVVDNITANPVPSVVAISGPISIRGPIIAKPPDTTWWQKLQGSDFWLGEAGAAYLGLIAGIAALFVSILAYQVVRYQNRIIVSQGASQIALLEKQNAIQDEMAAWQVKQGESQDALSVKQFELQKQMADWQKSNAETNLFPTLFFDLMDADDKFCRNYLVRHARLLENEDTVTEKPGAVWRQLVHDRIEFGTALFSQINRLSFLMHSNVITNPRFRETFNNEIFRWAGELQRLKLHDGHWYYHRFQDYVLSLPEDTPGWFKVEW